MSDIGRYRKLYARLWRHPGFTSLTDGEKVLAFYLLTGPQTNRLGIYVFSIATAAENLGTVPQTLTKRLERVSVTFGWLFDKKARVVYIPSWFKWNPPENLNVVKGSLKDLNEIPPCAFVDAFARNIETLHETVRPTFIEGLRQRLPKGMATQDQYQEQEQKQEQKPTTNGNGAALFKSARLSSEKNGKDSSDEKLIEAARQTLRFTNPHEPIDELVDAFRIVSQTMKGCPEFTKTEAVQALNVALSEYRIAHGQAS